MKKYLLYLVVVLSFSIVRAQDKVEIQYPVRASEVPASALKMVSYLSLGEHVTWYHEEHENGFSWEAKITGDHIYNVEFDQEGSLEDIEVDYAMDELTSESFVAISSTLSRLYPHYKVRKLQLHFDSLGDFMDARKDVNLTVAGAHRFEIVFETTYNNIYTLKEALLEADGDLIRAREVNMVSCDFSEY